ncbi:putative williams-beuren syndrome critical region protein [Cryptosporidium felis]|nr:putative williams-beuren syndrome critical region protein [Cryptosporidium felis]
MSTLYLEAARILNKVERNKLGIRTVIYSEKQRKCNLRKLGALVYGVSGRRKELDNILNKSNILNNSEICNITNYWLLLVLTYEQLFGNLKIQGGGFLARLIRKNKDKLYECFIKEYPDFLKDCKKNKVSEQIPRYLRVNTSIDNVNNILRTISDQLKLRDKYYEDIENYIWVDKDIPNLLVCKLEIAKLLCLDRIPSNNELIRTNKLVLQDKGSCFSPISANISPGDIVLDACSAPGSKTLQVIDLLNKSGCLIALDKDFNRIKTLIKRITQVPYLSGPFTFTNGNIIQVDPNQITERILNDQGCFFLDKDTKLDELSKSHPPTLLIHVVNCDFLSIAISKDDENLPWYSYRSCISRARIIILDPSCSGSGLPQHGNINRGEIENRLKNLSEFQTKVLLHSLTMFDSVKTVCYSTCSVFREENEQVVYNVLEKLKNETKVTFSLDYALKDFQSFQKRDSNHLFDDIYKKCLFLTPEIHNCRGFFLAKFKRVEMSQII